MYGRSWRHKLNGRFDKMPERRLFCKYEFFTIQFCYYMHIWVYNCKWHYRCGKKGNDWIFIFYIRACLNARVCKNNFNAYCIAQTFSLYIKYWLMPKMPEHPSYASGTTLRADFLSLCVVDYFHNVRI